MGCSCTQASSQDFIRVYHKPTEHQVRKDMKGNQKIFISEDVSVPVLRISESKLYQKRKKKYQRKQLKSKSNDRWDLSDQGSIFSNQTVMSDESQNN